VVSNKTASKSSGSIIRGSSVQPRIIASASCLISKSLAIPKIVSLSSGVTIPETRLGKIILWITCCCSASGTMASMPY